jgi:hypothetical protein
LSKLLERAQSLYALTCFGGGSAGDIMKKEACVCKFGASRDAGWGILVIQHYSDCSGFQGRQDRQNEFYGVLPEDSHPIATPQPPLGEQGGTALNFTVSALI